MLIKNRTNCNNVTKNLLGKVIKVSGWVNKRRNHGSLIFIDLRDFTGILQIVFDKKFGVFNEIEHIRNEFVVEITGTVRKRSKDNINLAIKTGHIELIANSIKILNDSETPVFEINDKLNIDENIRLKYRYLDLRRNIIKENIIKRHQIIIFLRNFLDKKNFLEIETPILGKSTPEGARDYLIPSRIHPGCFFSLPQSPQQYKQILMVSGIEKYFQFARCFRDEDLRADRQPEFTQLDIEMSFVTKEEIILLVNEMIRNLFKKILSIKLPKKILQMTYEKALELYGSDHPDLRFELLLQNITSIFKNTKFKIFQKILNENGFIKGINIKNGCNNLKRKDIEKLNIFIQNYNINGLSWIEINNNNIKSNIIKFLSKKEINSIIKIMKAEEGDLLLFVADKNKDLVNYALGALRVEVAKKINIIDENKFEFVWITDFPLFKYDKENNKYISVHHMFTQPNIKEINNLIKNPLLIKSLAYDLVLNGIEIGGGSIRIHKKELQQQIFKIIGLKNKEIKKQFGFLLEAFSYGAPPHGGIAFGIDRLIMIIQKCKSIRDVIAFPKIQSSMDLMFLAPGKVSDNQIKELHIKKFLQ